MTRKEANLELVAILHKLASENTDDRFHQILRNYGFIQENGMEDHSPKWVNEFYAEPQKVLERVKAKIKEMENLK